MSFEGSIGEIDLVHRLVELGREHFTGAIRFEQDGIIKIVYFKNGDVLSASTNDRKDAVDEILLRAGKVSREHIKQALAKRQESETLGDALLNLGFITRKELTWARRIQVIGILRSVRAWTDGQYAIVADYLPKREEGTLFPLPQIIVEFTVTEQDRQTFDRAMDGGEAVFHKTPAFDEAFPGLDLNEDAADITSQIDGTKSAAEIASVTGKDAFNVYKLLEALRILGLIEKAGAMAAPPLEDLGFESAGVADAADAWNFTPQPEPEPAAAPEPAWNLAPESEPEPQPAPAPPPIVMPAFEPEPPKVPFALKLDHDDSIGAVPPPLEQPEQQWGFDDAQIETARRATEPSPTRPAANPRRVILPQPKQKQKKRGGDRVFVVIVSLLLAGIIVGGWVWWKKLNAPVAATPVVTRPAKHPVIQPAPPPIVATASTATAGTIPLTMTTIRPPVTATTASVAPAPPRPSTTPTTPTTPTAGAEGPQEKSRLEQTGSGRMITNTPAGQMPTDKNRDHYDTLAQQYAANPVGNYTIQFELVCQTSSLGKAVAGGGSNVWFVPVKYRSQTCFRVFWGHFNDHEAAVAALEHIPAALRGSTPVVVPVPKP